MFWLLRKIFWLAVLIGLIYYGSQYQVNGRPLKDYASEFYRSPIVQAVIKTGQEMLGEAFHKKGEALSSSQAKSESVAAPAAEPDGHELTEQDQEALQRLLEKR